MVELGGCRTLHSPVLCSGLSVGSVPSNLHCAPGCPYLFPLLGRINVKNEELDAMVKEAPGPINFTVFLTMFGEKLKGE